MPWALGDSKGEIKLWHVNPTGDVPPEEPKATLNDRSSEIAHLSWHPKVPQQLAAASADKIVRQVPPYSSASRFSPVTREQNTTSRAPCMLHSMPSGCHCRERVEIQLVPGS